MTVAELAVALEQVQGERRDVEVYIRLVDGCTSMTAGVEIDKHGVVYVKADRLS